MTPITPATGDTTPMIRFCFATLAALLGTPAMALDLPAGAIKTAETRLAPAEFARAHFNGQKVPMISAPGEMRVEAWQVKGDGQTNYQLLKSLTDQLTGEGYQPVFQCQAVSCGGYDFRFAVGKFSAPELFVDLGSFQYATLRKDKNIIGLLVSHSGADGFVQISRTAETDTVAKAPTATPAPSPPPLTGLVATLLERGHVVLTDVRFATGSSTLAKGPNTQLSQLAQFLSDRPKARLALVGHTDAQGQLDTNVALSRKRAASVRNALIKEYGISAARLQAEGVGYLSPLTTNLSPEGREANRRVEAVLLNVD